MFTIKLWDAENLWTEIGTVSGCEAAYEAFARLANSPNWLTKIAS